MEPASVIIVSYRTPELTLTAVHSALGADVNEVIVVDNGMDETVDVLHRLSDPRLKIIPNSTNVGFGAAANAGASAAVSEHLIFLNSDAHIASAAARALTDELTIWQGRAIAGPRLVSLDGSVQRSAGLLPRPFDLTVRALGLHRLALVLHRLPVLSSWIGRTATAAEYATAERANVPVDVNMVSGACLAIGRRCFVELGGFDERYFMYFEDADLCRRAAAVGVPIRFIPTAVVPHISGASSAEDYHFGALHGRSMRQYLEKWYGPAGALLVLFLLSARLAAFAMTLRPDTERAMAALRAAARP